MNGIYFIALVFIALPIKTFCAEAAPSPLEPMLRNRALIRAIEQNNEPEARQLIEQGARIDQKVLIDTRISFGEITPTNGQPYMMLLPLLDHLLVRFEHEPEQRKASVRLLVELGGSAHYINIFGRTPLFYAPTATLAQLFLTAGCTPNYSDQFGRRALHEAMRHGRSDVVQALLARGALPTVQDHTEHLPADFIALSQMAHHLSCLNLLKDPQIAVLLSSLPRDIIEIILYYLPIDASLVSKPVYLYETDFADSYIQQTVDAPQ